MTIISRQTAPSPPSWSRLIRFITHSGQTVFGEPVDPNLDIGLALARGDDVEAYVLDLKVPWGLGERTGEVEVVHELLSPLSADMCGLIRAVGLNYVDHAAELGVALPDVPTLFFKPPHALANPNARVGIPHAAQDEEMDFEVELAIVLGKEAKNVSEEEAMEYVLGFTVANDLTARKHWQKSSQWGFCKGFDNFCPVGPCIVSPHAVPDLSDLSLQTRVNGELMQDGHTASMIFSVPKLISYLSQGTTLPAGTIIITGTPPGIGDSRNPKVWLKHGDEVHCSISGGLGTLVNRIEYESKPMNTKVAEPVKAATGARNGTKASNGHKLVSTQGLNGFH